MADQDVISSCGAGDELTQSQKRIAEAIVEDRVRRLRDRRQDGRPPQR
jgi:hypothetical protein